MTPALAEVASSLGGQQVLGPGLAWATWTEDEALSTRISRRVAHYTGQGLQASSEGVRRRRPRGWAGRWRWRIRRVMRIALSQLSWPAATPLGWMT